MDQLAVELLEKIFSYLDDDSLNNVELVCRSWSQIIVARFWFPRLASVSLKDNFLRLKFASEGWDFEQSGEQDELNRRIYKQLNRKWDHGSCTVDRRLIHTFMVQGRLRHVQVFF
jgi:hypothetical protein